MKLKSFFGFFLLFMMGCKIGLTHANPLYLGKWQSEVFQRGNKEYFFQVDFNLSHNKVEVRRYKKTSTGNHLRDDFEERYTNNSESIECVHDGRVYKFKYIDDEKIFIYYNGMKILMFKI